MPKPIFYLKIRITLNFFYREEKFERFFFQTYLLKKGMVLKMKKSVMKLVLGAATVFSAAVLMYSALADRSITRNDDLPTPPLYVVGEYGGRLAVFPFGADWPRTVTEVRLDTLPLHDADLLRQGIEVYSENELQSLLEDFDTY